VATSTRTHAPRTGRADGRPAAALAELRTCGSVARDGLWIRAIHTVGWQCRGAGCSVHLATARTLRDGVRDALSCGERPSIDNHAQGLGNTVIIEFAFLSTGGWWNNFRPRRDYLRPCTHCTHRRRRQRSLFLRNDPMSSKANTCG
jgi:hypothetical protein